MINCTNYKYEELQRQIRDRRDDLYNLASKNGLASELVIKCSQDLDRLLNQLMQMERADQAATA